MDAKRSMLAYHASQKRWLDESQGLDSYIDAMADQVKRIGVMSGEYEYAEGWRRHLHIGFSGDDLDPLYETISEYCMLAT